MWYGLVILMLKVMASKETGGESKGFKEMKTVTLKNGSGTVFERIIFPLHISPFFHHFLDFFMYLMSPQLFKQNFNLSVFDNTI